MSNAVIFVVVLHLIAFPCSEALAVLPGRWGQDIAQGYKRRVAADPSFLAKSFLEVTLAASTQLAAECQRRGASNLISEIDFVFSGVLTAVYGKYASMWKVARTVAPGAEIENVRNDGEERNQEASLCQVPTNAFQPFLLDGKTRPTVKQRLGSFVVPLAPLFRAGVVAGFAGYGFSAVLIAIRSLLFPSYEAATRPVNVVWASLYTGSFMAVVSNIRYQLMQGLLEPTIDRVLKDLPPIRALVIFAVRFGNGMIGSMLAISGMRALGLQRMK